MPLTMVLAHGLLRRLGMAQPGERAGIARAPRLFALFLLPAAAEELGWTGYTLDRLQARHTALQAGLIEGGVWAAVHVVPYVQMGRSAPWIAGQSLQTVAARVLMVWLHNNTGRSVSPAILFHTMMNVSEFLSPDERKPAAPACAALVLGAAAALVTWLWGAGTLTRWRYDPGARSCAFALRQRRPGLK